MLVPCSAKGKGLRDAPALDCDQLVASTGILRSCLSTVGVWFDPAIQRNTSINDSSLLVATGSPASRANWTPAIARQESCDTSYSVGRPVTRFPVNGPSAISPQTQASR